MKQKKTHKVLAVCIVSLCLFAFLAFAIPYTVNVMTNHRLHYLWGEITGYFSFGSGRYVFLGYTPDGRHSLHLVDDSWQGNSITIESTHRFSYEPTKTLALNDEDLKTGLGPLTKDFDVVCSRNARYIALIRNGWFIDLYDFQTDMRNSLTVVLVGKINDADMETWRVYHSRVLELIGTDYISMLPADTQN